MMDSSVYAMAARGNPTCMHCGRPYIEGQDTDGNPKVWHMGGPVRFVNARHLDEHHTPEQDPEHVRRLAEWGIE